jgi:glucose/arabinose dehydrogenase
MERVAENLNFPTSVAVDTEGTVYVAESGLSLGGAPDKGSILRIGSDGRRSCLLTGLRPPVNGVSYHKGSLFISEGGYPGRISRFDLFSGEWMILADQLPGFGNYHTNMAVVGPDEKLYFSQGAMTNSGIIGLDSYDLGWLRHVPHNCDIPGYDVVLTGVNAETTDPRESDTSRKVRTGAFVPFGTSTVPGQKVEGRIPCTSSVMRCNLDGSGLELVAWGLRNAYGLRFLPDGRLLATEQGSDDRGSRPIANCPDFLYEVRRGAWYGWPDFIGGVPVTDPRFQFEGGPETAFLLANHCELPVPERPLLKFETNTSPVKFGVVPSEVQSCPGHLIVALFGDERYSNATGPPAGRELVRINPSDWTIHPVKAPQMHRPIDVAFAPYGLAMYVVDFGEFEIAANKKVQARSGSGMLWKLDPDVMHA